MQETIIEFEGVSIKVLEFEGRNLLIFKDSYNYHLLLKHIMLDLGHHVIQAWYDAILPHDDAFWKLPNNIINTKCAYINGEFFQKKIIPFLENHKPHPTGEIVIIDNGSVIRYDFWNESLVFAEWFVHFRSF